MDISDAQALGFMRRAAYELNSACAQSRLTLIEAQALLRAAHKIATASYGVFDGANKSEG